MYVTLCFLSLLQTADATGLSDYNDAMYRIHSERTGGISHATAPQLARHYRKFPRKNFKRNVIVFPQMSIISSSCKSLPTSQQLYYIILYYIILYYIILYYIILLFGNVRPLNLSCVFKSFSIKFPLCNSCFHALKLLQSFNLRRNC
jgi:hypothetical protein